MKSIITDLFSQVPKNETVCCFISTRKRPPKEPKRRPKKIKVVQPITISLDTSSSDSDSTTESVEL